jgi:hypothetical protein
MPAVEQGAVATGWGPVVSSTATGLRRTTIHEPSPGSYLWWLRPGSADPAPRYAMPERFRPALKAASTARLRLVLPVAHETGLLYRTASPLSAAFWQGAGPVVEERLAENLGAVVRGLGGLHRIPVTSPLPAPPGLVRLRHWLDHPDHTSGGARLHDLALRHWGAAGLGRIRSWTTELGGRTGSLVHGNLSLAAILPTLDNAGPVELLTGPEVSGGDPAFDLGWLLGELLELTFAAPRQAAPRQAGNRQAAIEEAAAAPLTAAVLRAAADLDPGLIDRPVLHRAGVLRIVTHMRDHACAMPWTDELAGYTDLISTLLDAAPGDLGTLS